MKQYEVAIQSPHTGRRQPPLFGSEPPLRVMKSGIWLFALLLATACDTAAPAGLPDASRDAGFDGDATVDEPDGPRFATEPALFAIAGEEYLYASRATLAAPEYQLVTAPSGMVIDPVTGDITWLPEPSQGGSHTVVVQATGDDGLPAEQTYLLEVAVPRTVGEAEIGEDGGEISGGGVVVSIPAGAVTEPTTFVLSLLEEGLPPLWEEMNMLGLPFIVRSDSGVPSGVPAILSYETVVPEGMTALLAREEETAHAAATSIGGMVVVDPTTTGLTEGEIRADLTARRRYLNLTGWYAWTTVKVTLYGDARITVAWVDNGTPNAAAATISNRIVAALRAAQRQATGAMGCDSPDELVLYIASFVAGSGAGGTEHDEVMYINKRLTALPRQERNTVNHEYAHVIQEHMLNTSFLGWWAEPMAEHAAEEMFNSNISHSAYADMNEAVARLGLARIAYVPRSQIYQLYIYFRFVHETRGWQVCSFLRNNARGLARHRFYEAMSATLGDAEFSKSFRDFTEAYLFYREARYFGDDAPGIGSWAPETLSFTSEREQFATTINGGVGVQIERTSTDPQTLLISLEGGLVTGGSPLGLVRGSGDVILGEFTADEHELILEGVTARTLHVTASQGNMPAQAFATDVTIAVRELKIVVENQSGDETTEEGGAVTFDVSLGADPGENLITVTVTSTDTSEGVVNLTELSFDRDTWNRPQTVTVTGRTDGEIDGDAPYSIELAIAGPINWESVEWVELTNLDSPIEPYTINLGVLNDFASAGPTARARRGIVLSSRSSADIAVTTTTAYTGTLCLRTGQRDPRNNEVGVGQAVEVSHPVSMSASGTSEIEEGVTATWSSSFEITESTSSRHGWYTTHRDAFVGEDQRQCSAVPDAVRGSPYTSHGTVTATLPGLPEMVVYDATTYRPPPAGLTFMGTMLRSVRYISDGEYELEWRMFSGEVTGDQIRNIYETRVDSFVGGAMAGSVITEEVIGGYLPVTRNGTPLMGSPIGTFTVSSNETDGEHRHASYLYVR